MAQPELHPIDDYLSDAWIVDWADEVVREIERYLAKHAAFDSYADHADGNPPTP